MTVDPKTIERFRAAFVGSVPDPLAILDRGEGMHVWDDAGTQYLDFLGGIAVNALGHAHPALVGAIIEQLGKVAHISNYYASEPEIALAERLKRLSGADKVFFCNSGTEANEAAIKLARLTGRTRMVALEDGFHGRSTGALAITSKDAYRAPFAPLMPGAAFISATLEALDAEFTEHGSEIAAIFIEPIQGEAGVVDLPDGFLARARALTREHGALLILDEVQTGAGRTGKWFAFQHDWALGGDVPDVVTLAKGLGGGLPIGSMLTFGSAAELLKPGQHGTTFGGNPLMTAAANAVLAEIERAGLVDNAALRGEEIRSFIEDLGSPLVAGTTGDGLLIGVVLTGPYAAAMHHAALEHGLIINAAAGDRVRLAPPLIIGDAEVAEFEEKFVAALADISPSSPVELDDMVPSVGVSTGSTRGGGSTRGDGSTRGGGSDLGTMGASA